MSRGERAATARVTSLSAVAGSLVALAGVLSSASAGFVAAVGGSVVACVAAALVVAVGSGALAAVWGRLIAQAVDEVVEGERVNDSRWRNRLGGTELARLHRTFDALHLRARVADELAEQQRRSAETASAGMFEMLSGLVAAEESARGQLSAELHDTVAQSLMHARSILAGSTDADQVRFAAELVGEAEEQVRAVMARTRPPALRDGDLARAMGVLREDLANRYGLMVSFCWPERPHPLPLATAVTVYRFYQEALLNVVKHADVDEAEASLEIDGDTLVATVRDEGPGFDPDAVRSERGRHVGLGLLKERARLAGGQVEVVSWPEAGTVLRLRMAIGGVAGRRAEAPVPPQRSDMTSSVASR